MAAAQGDEYAQARLDELNANGESEAQEDTKAFGGIPSKRRKPGDAEAQYQLGLLYEKGEGVEQGLYEGVVLV